MKAKILFPAIFILAGLLASAQRPIMELTFSAVNNASWVKLDSIKIMNRTQGGETLLYWPDTSLSFEINNGDLLLYIGYTTFSTEGILEVADDVSSFYVYQNYPNPMEDRSEVSMYIPHPGEVQMMITDLQGKVVLRTDRQLDKGHHVFRYHPGGGNIYFFRAHWNGTSRSIKMISTGQKDVQTCKLDYIGSLTGEPVLKTSFQANDFIVRQSGILDYPDKNQVYTFQFATNIPCPGTPTVDYEGQVYNTIQIFSQCWLKENLNVGLMIPGNQNQTNDNTIIEKYCYNNEPDSCAKYGGLYQWEEMMQYSTQQAAQGICPPGWHLPMDEEWKVLEGAVDSQYGIGDLEWDLYWDYRGYDAGKNLKTTGGWNANGNGTDLFGFSGLPGGVHYYAGTFGSVTSYSSWWASTEADYGHAWSRYLQYGYPGVYRDMDSEADGFSVRCLRND
jgi:uncharacterized protein (TIGR02145 family)